MHVMVICGCTAVAALMIVTGIVPRSMETLPDLFVRAWMLLLAVGGLTALAGAYWRGRIDTALTIEGGGCGMFGAMLWLYVLLLFVGNTSNALVAGGLIGSLGAGAWWRVAQILRDLRKLGAARERGRTVHVPLLVEGDEPPAGQP